MKDFQMILELKELLVKTFKDNKEIFPTRPYDTMIIAGLIDVYKSKTRVKELDFFIKECIENSLGDVCENECEEILTNHQGFIAFKKIVLHFMDEAKKG